MKGIVAIVGLLKRRFAVHTYFVDKGNSVGMEQYVARNIENVEAVFVLPPMELEEITGAVIANLDAYFAETIKQQGKAGPSGNGKDNGYSSLDVYQRQVARY